MLKKMLVVGCLFYSSGVVAKVWQADSFKKPSMQVLKQQLTELQYAVTQEDDTEPPFKNRYWDHFAPGIYVDIVSGEPLFSSLDKFKSKSGWPSFTKPLVKEHMVYKADNSLFVSRTEVRSKHADSHLGHVFDDGPKPTGKRYCINAAALRFVPAAELEQQGYGAWQKLFAAKPADNAKVAIQELETITLAGGCFWCVEADFAKLKGVKDAVSGYMGGHVEQPSYKQVSAGGTGHIEVVQVVFDRREVSLKKVLKHFFYNIDPTQKNGQFCDHGPQYRSAVFYHSPEQKKLAQKLKDRFGRQLKQELVTELLPKQKFYAAEAYHQDYAEINPLRYKAYRFNCGRDGRLKDLWGR